MGARKAVSSWPVSVRREHVADAPHRADHRRPGGIGLDLLADAGDPDVDGPVEGFAVPGTRQIEKPLARQDAARVFDEGLQEGEFAVDQRLFLAILATQRLGVEIEPLGAEAHLAALMRQVCACARRITERMRASSSRNSQGLAR